MAILRKIIISSLPLLLSGCYEDFDARIDADPVLCLNSLITAGQPIEVSVTHTWLYTDEKGEEDHSVNDAEVKIYANGNLIGSDYLPQEGDIIKIEAFSNTYGSAEAEVTVPVATSISDLSYKPTIKDNRIYDREEWGLSIDLDFDIDLTLSMPNPEGAKSYYNLSFTKFIPKDSDYTDSDYDNYENENENGELLRWATPPSSVHFYEGSIFCKDPFFSEFVSAIDDAMDYADPHDFFYFSNRQFKGKSQDLHIEMNGCSFRIAQWDRNPELLDCGVIFNLYTISESYYYWMNYCWQSNESIMGDFIEFGLAEPMWGYSNVSTGAGVVAARSYSAITLNLQDFLYDSCFDCPSVLNRNP